MWSKPWFTHFTGVENRWDATYVCETCDEYIKSRNSPDVWWESGWHLASKDHTRLYCKKCYDRGLHLLPPKYNI